MRKTSLYLAFIFIATCFLGFSQTEEKTEAVNEAQTEFEILVNHLQENGNFINSDLAPALISPDEVKKNLKNDNFLILDIRSESWFEYGHIKNAVNIKAAELLNYFQNDIDPAAYEKIAIVCYSGQSASYFASLLRIAGFDNVYSMKWGMSSWRMDFAENSWLKNLKDDYADQAETTPNAKAEKGTFPVLETGKTTAEEILQARLEELFAIPYKQYIIKAPALFENLADHYIVHYWCEDKYNEAHIPGAVYYKPNTSLDFTADLATLPTDKRIALYDANGLGTAYVVAYLNVLGYDAGNIAYGANGFMNKTVKDKKWGAFSNKDVNMFPVIE